MQFCHIIYLEGFKFIVVMDVGIREYIWDML